MLSVYERDFWKKYNNQRGPADVYFSNIYLCEVNCTVLAFYFTYSSNITTHKTDYFYILYFAEGNNKKKGFISGSASSTKIPKLKRSRNVAF